MKFLAKAASMEHLPELMVTLPIDRASMLFATFATNYYGQPNMHIKQAYKLSPVVHRLQFKGRLIRDAEVVDKK